MKYQASMNEPPTSISGRRSKTRSAPALRSPRARTARRGLRERGWIFPSQAGSSRAAAIGRTTREALSRSPRISASAAAIAAARMTQVPPWSHCLLRRGEHRRILLSNLVRTEHTERDRAGTDEHHRGDRDAADDGDGD